MLGANWLRWFPGLDLADGVDQLGYPEVKGPPYQGHAIGNGWKPLQADGD